jgi:hypothetical protein
LNELRCEATIETHGGGARGYNVYDGVVRSAEFDRIVTHGDGAVGVQISRPVGRLMVRRGIETRGGTGDSLVKGVIVKLAAVPLSGKPGGSIREVSVRGGLVAGGSGVPALELRGDIGVLDVTGGLTTAPETS